ncbi:permease [Saccharomonospora glauca]|uniref:Putative permease n=1 Tax=Saccharomonospora glauca K62 TaxID=928724 RepID=I1D0E1_9PSEU|nr:permease [Saccharomonospora glauca]EIE98415.1 putative permease [Saccharomonospora glauca K62]
MSEDSATSTDSRGRRRITSIEVLCAVLLVAIVGQSWLVSLLDVPVLRTASTVFVAVCVQALPFLVLGVLISGALAAFVPARALRAVLPRGQSAAVGVAGLSGVVLPGCECASVPVARRLIGQGVAPAAALTFLLAAPAVNPVVMVATAVAFPGEPGMVVARFVASVVMGLVWIRWGRSEWIAERVWRRVPESGGNRWVTFAETARADLVDAGGFLVLGALVSAVLGVLVPPSWFSVLSDDVVLGVVVMAVLAVVLSLCSEADAFVVASLAPVPLLPKLVFLVVGPAVDLKLFALQAGTFGRAFAVRFAPATFVVAVGCAVLTGTLVLGEG